MKRSNYKPLTINSEKGVALIIALGILAILAILGTSFAINMRLEQKAAANYRDSTKAKYLAQMGIEKAIAVLKWDATQHAFYYPAGITNDYAWAANEEADVEDGCLKIISTGSLGQNVYTNTVKIIDCASQIDINGPATLTENMLNKLADFLGSPMESGDGTEIINAMPTNGYITKEQIKLAQDIGESKYNKIKDYITVNTYFDSHCGNRSPVNVNTANTDVLAAVLAVVTGDNTQAGNLANAIVTSRAIAAFGTWEEFEQFVDSGGYPASVKNNCNPNRTTDSGSCSATEFCFHSGGYYEIQSTAILRDLQDTTDIAKKEIIAIVKIFDISNKTTRSEFVNDMTNYLVNCRTVDVALNTNDTYGTPFYIYQNAVQIPHLIVETENTSGTNFYFEVTNNAPEPLESEWTVVSVSTNTPSEWQPASSGGYDKNPYAYGGSDGYYYRYDGVEITCTNAASSNATFTVVNQSTCKWSYDIDTIRKGHYNIYTWWEGDTTNNSQDVDYSYFSDVDQSTNIGTWYSLATNQVFSVGINDVEIGAATIANTNRYTIADAMLLAAVNFGTNDCAAGIMDGSFVVPSGANELGTIGWTDYNISTNISVTFDVDTTTTNFNETVGSLVDGAGGALGDSLDGVTNIYYRVYFRKVPGEGTALPPILDDITVTYLPRAKILYWREE